MDLNFNKKGFVYIKYFSIFVKKQDGDMEPDPTSTTDATKLIVNMLKERGLI